MKKFKFIAIAVVALSLLVTLCACNADDDVDHSFDTTTRAPGGDVTPNDTTDKIVDNVPPSNNPYDTTETGQEDDTTPDLGDDTTEAPNSSSNNNLVTDGPNDFGELHPPTPKE